MARNIKTEPIDQAVARTLNSEYHRYPGVTRQLISDRTGIPLTTIQRLFTGHSAWSVSQFIAVIEAIGTSRSAEYLFREALDLLPEIEATLSAAPSNVTNIRRDKEGDEWINEEQALREDAVAKKDTIVIPPEDVTP